MFDNTLRQIKAIIYRLKRNFGTPVTIVRLSNLQNNIQTGAMTFDKQEIDIRRGIVDPALALRDFVYDLSFIAANKNFTYGGYFDVDSRMLIIDSKDLPTGFEPNLNDYALINNSHYAFKEVHPLANKHAWSMTIKQVDAIPTES